MYTIRLVFNRKMVHFTSGSYVGPCEKTFSPFSEVLKNQKLDKNKARCSLYSDKVK